MLNIQEKASEYRRWSDRISQMYDVTEPDFVQEWREEWSEDVESFVFALSKGDTSFSSYAFPEGFFDGWGWIDSDLLTNRGGMRVAALVDYLSQFPDDAVVVQSFDDAPASGDYLVLDAIDFWVSK